MAPMFCETLKGFSDTNDYITPHLKQIKPYSPIIIPSSSSSSHYRSSSSSSIFIIFVTHHSSNIFNSFTKSPPPLLITTTSLFIQRHTQNDHHHPNSSLVTSPNKPEVIIESHQLIYTNNGSPQIVNSPRFSSYMTRTTPSFKCNYNNTSNNEISSSSSLTPTNNGENSLHIHHEIDLILISLGFNCSYTPDFGDGFDSFFEKKQTLQSNNIMGFLVIESLIR